MSRPGSREPRRHLDELEPGLRERVQALDEPVARPDWQDVARRSRRFQWRSRMPAWSMAAGVAAGAAALLAGFWIVGTGGPRGGHLPVRLSLQMSNGSHLVLYSAPRTQMFVDHADDRHRGDRRALLARNSVHGAEASGLLGGPFDVGEGLIRSTATSRSASPTPLPGDEEFVSFVLYFEPVSSDESGIGHVVLHVWLHPERVLRGDVPAGRTGATCRLRGDRSERYEALLGSDQIERRLTR